MLNLDVTKLFKVKSLDRLSVRTTKISTKVNQGSSKIFKMFLTLIYTIVFKDIGDQGDQ